MNASTKRSVSAALAALLFLSMTLTFSIPSALAQTTYVSVLNTDTGDGNFIYNTTNPPPPGGIVVNITITDVIKLAGWQVNLTWDPDLLTVSDTSAGSSTGDVYAPPGCHVFHDLDPQFPGKNINNGEGFVVWACAIGPAASKDNFNGSGLLMNVLFTVIDTPNSTNTLLSCNIVLDTVGLFLTKLTDPDGELITFTEQNGYYEYSWVPPPPVLPYLEISPVPKEVGMPLSGPIVGTPNAFFTVDVLIKNVTIDHDIIGVQWNDITFNNTLIRCYNPADPTQNVTEGTFMNNPAWAPYGTTFIYFISENDPSWGLTTVLVGIIINPGPGDYNWTGRPYGEGVLCTWHFEVLYQDVYPWTASIPLEIGPLFPGELFLNTSLLFTDYLPPDGCKDGEIIIYGYIMGRQVDLYVGAECHKYPFPYGGQGPNATADMFLPQKKVCMWANVTYNMWPVQAKVVTFEIIDPLNETVTVVSGISDDDGVAFASFRIPWPCDPDLREAYLCGVFTIIASVDIACNVTKDWLWFHFDYLVRWEEIIITPGEIGHCGYVNFTVWFRSKALLPYWVLITIDLKDELQVPIGFDMMWSLVGVRPMDEWCTYAYYFVEFSIHIPKHAFAGIATVHINALTTLPSLCGYAVTPELGQWDLVLPTFTILAAWA